MASLETSYQCVRINIIYDISIHLCQYLDTKIKVCEQVHWCCLTNDSNSVQCNFPICDLTNRWALKQIYMHTYSNPGWVIAEYNNCQGRYCYISEYSVSTHTSQCHFSGASDTFLARDQIPCNVNFVWLQSCKVVSLSEGSSYIKPAIQ